MSKKVNNPLRDFQIAIGGEYMYMDVEEFMKQIELLKSLEVVEGSDEKSEVSINLPKFEFFKLMLDVWKKSEYETIEQFFQREMEKLA